MRDMTKAYFTVAYIVALVVGIIYSLTIVGLIFGIPLFMASKRFKLAKDMSDADLVSNRSSLFGWGIFTALVMSPTVIGLIIMLVFVVLVNNQIKNIEAGATEEIEKSFEQTVKEGASNTWDAVKSGTKNVWNDLKDTFGGKSDLDKQKEELDKLNKMKEEGIITEEEYEAKRKQILGL